MRCIERDVARATSWLDYATRPVSDVSSPKRAGVHSVEVLLCDGVRVSISSQGCSGSAVSEHVLTHLIYYREAAFSAWFLVIGLLHKSIMRSGEAGLNRHDRCQAETATKFAEARFDACEPSVMHLSRLCLVAQAHCHMRSCGIQAMMHHG